MVERYATVLTTVKSPFEGDVRWYMTAAGYTKSKGCPTDYMVRVKGSGRLLRVYNYCTSNSGTLFVYFNGGSKIVNDYDLNV
jgi:hypothetical protein